MGSTNWSDEVYNLRSTKRIGSKTGGFDYDAAVKADADMYGTKLEVHKDLDVKITNKAGQLIRESRDSEKHPESLAISVIFDVTGSMHSVPKLLSQKLGTIMNLLIQKGYVKHPQIMFGALGDWKCGDEVPIQVGQWESGIEQDHVLTKIVLEGKGGHGDAESHGLTLYYLARHTAMDCLEKRGEKGYLFLITDEPPYEKVTAQEIKEQIGDIVESDIPIKKIIDELKDKFNIFLLIPHDTANYKNKEMLETWKGFFGQHVVFLKNPAEAAETIASIIGLTEGVIDENGVEKDLRDLGVDKNTAQNVTMAVQAYAKGGDKKMVKRDKATVEGKLPATRGKKSNLQRV